MGESPGPMVNCPYCGAVNPAAEEVCHACSKRLTLYIGPARTMPKQFGLGSLMVLVAIVAVGLGILRESPPLGVLVLLLIAPAMVRTYGVTSQRSEDDRPTTFEEKSFILLGSIGLMIAVLVSSVVAFAVVCVPLGMFAGSIYGTGVLVAVGVGIIAALVVGVLILKKFWPYRG